MPIRNLHPSHPHPRPLRQLKRMPHILPRQIHRKQRLVLPILAPHHPRRIRRIRPGKHRLDKAVQILAAQPALLRQRVPLRQRLHHIEDERVADDLQVGRARGRLVAVVDGGAAEHARRVRLHERDGGRGARDHADELAGGGHGGGAEDGARDEVRGVGFDLVGEGGGGVRVDGGAVDEEFVGYVGLEGGDEGGGDGGVVAEAGEDYGGLGDGGGEGGGDGGGAGGEGGGEVGGALGVAVEDYKGVGEVALFDEVLAHALVLG